MLVTNIHQIFSKCHLPGQTGWSLHKGSSPELSQFRTLQSWFPFLSSVFIFFMILFYRNELYRITDACITTKLKRGQSKSFNSMAHMVREDNMYKPRPLLHLIFFFWPKLILNVPAALFSGGLPTSWGCAANNKPTPLTIPTHWYKILPPCYSQAVTFF